ncbi:carbohydrate porin [Cupriavidus campinensis]
MLQSQPPTSRLHTRRLTFAVLAAWGLAACAQTGDQVAAPPQITQLAVPPTATASARQAAPAAPAVPVASPAATPTVTPAADPLGDLIQSAATEAGVDPDFVGPPESAAPPPPPPPPLVLFPHRLGEFPAQPVEPPKAAASDMAGSETADMGTAPDAVSDTPPVLRSQLPPEDRAGESVWRLGYSGRAAVEDRAGTQRACAGGGTPSVGTGGGLACTSTGEVKIRESLADMGGGTQLHLVAQAKGTNATSVDGNAKAVDPYALVPQFYTAVSGLSGLAVLDGASVWAGRRESNPFLMSSGLLPPNSPSMRFGVDNAKLGDFGINYQYTARNDLNGAHLPSYHSLRSAPIDTNDKGAVQLGFTRVEPLSAMEDTGSAWWASAMHEQKGVLYGTNRLGVQYGQGSRTAMTGYTGMGASLSRVRVAESVEWKSRSGIGGSVESSLQMDRSPVGTMQWAATRVRPAYVANDQFRLMFEVAHDQISSGFGVGGQRTALTVAPTFTLGKSTGNANLRAFYTYSRASDVDGITFAAPPDTWATQATGSIFGVQLNRRW